MGKRYVTVTRKYISCFFTFIFIYIYVLISGTDKHTAANGIVRYLTTIFFLVFLCFFFHPPLPFFHPIRSIQSKNTFEKGKGGPPLPSRGVIRYGTIKMQDGTFLFVRKFPAGFDFFSRFIDRQVLEGKCLNLSRRKTRRKLEKPRTGSRWCVLWRK